MMNILEEAKNFAIKAHMGQIRKSEPDKPMIMHPLMVGSILMEYGFDKNVIAAGFLHDVIEDTHYRKEDLTRLFGSDITSLVVRASEPDKSLSWEERKRHTINSIKTLDLRHKAVVCADKISNLEDLMIKFQKESNRDFSCFKRGEKAQKWYYTNVYESLIYNEDSNLPIFKRLKNVIDIVFDKKEDLYLKDTIFKSDEKYYEELKRLHARKLELQKLKVLTSLKKPFIIEFSGTPRTGKTSTIYNIYDFFKKGGFNVSISEEFTTSDYYKTIFKSEHQNMDKIAYNLAIMDEVARRLIKDANQNQDIILIDRSINDRQIWNNALYKEVLMSPDKYMEAKQKYLELSKEYIDFLVMTYCDPTISLKRDYIGSLALEPRSFLNTKNITRFNNSLDDLHALFCESAENYYFLDTTNISAKETTLSIAKAIMPMVRKRYIDSFKEQYYLK